MPVEVKEGQAQVVLVGCGAPNRGMGWCKCLCDSFLYVAMVVPGTREGPRRKTHSVVYF
jgi:hypothetical protein